MNINTANITIKTSSVNAKQTMAGLDRFIAEVEKLARTHLTNSNVDVDLDVERRSITRLPAPNFDVGSGDRALTGNPDG